MKEIQEDRGPLGQNLNRLYNDLKFFMEPFEENISGKNIVEILISYAVGMACHCCSPNELEAMKTIMASVEMGILEYEKKK